VGDLLDMKKTELRRKTPLKAKTGLKRTGIRRKAKKAATVAEKAHMGSLASLGCIVCKNKFGLFSPACVHHVRRGMGMGQRKHLKTVPLCPTHHQTGGPGIAFHATGRDEWEELYGREEDLFKQAMEMLEGKASTY
jgi:hypothetical protein